MVSENEDNRHKMVKSKKESRHSSEVIIERDMQFYEWLNWFVTPPQNVSDNQLNFCIAFRLIRANMSLF